MKLISTKIDWTPQEKQRIDKVGAKLSNGIRVAFRSLCKRLVMMTVERIENGEES